MIEAHVEPDASTAAAKAAALFRTITAEAIAQRSRCAVALAGGSSPAAMHEALASEARVTVQWDAIEFFFGDERAVPSDTKDSNFHSAQHTLLDRVALDWRKVHPLEAWREPREEAAREYERALLRACPEEGALDLLVMGVGEDAHILSLYPGCPLITEDHGWLVAALRDPPMNPAVDRLTLTPTALFRARTVLVLFVGAKKSAAWRALNASEGSALTHPVRLLREHRGVVHCVGDAAAMR